MNNLQEFSLILDEYEAWLHTDEGKQHCREMHKYLVEEYKKTDDLRGADKAYFDFSDLTYF
jgi:hypothetical protein